MKKNEFLTLAMAFILFSTFPATGFAGNDNGLNCNPIIIYTRLNLNEACGLEGETIEVLLEIEDIMFDDIAFAIAYNPDLIAPVWIDNVENGYYFNMYVEFPTPGIIDFHIYSSEFLCSAMVPIYFSADSTGYSELEFVESVLYPQSLWWAIPNDGSITVSNPSAQVVHLKEGWNGISSFLIPNDVSVDQLFSPLGDNLEFLCCDDWHYYPGFNGGMVPVWNMYQGYFIKISDETNFILNGNLPQNNEIQLGVGWNLMPVTSCRSIFLNDFFGDNLSYVEIIMEAVSGNVCWPEKNIHSIDCEKLLPGKSYLVKMTVPCTLSPPQ